MTNDTQKKEGTKAKTAAPAKPASRPGGRGGGPGRRPGRPGGRGGRFDEPKEFDQRILELARVTRVTKGGKRMRFRTCIIIGDRKGRVGYGIAKGADVAGSVNKAVVQAKKRLIKVPIVNGTIPHVVKKKFTAANIIIKPAPKGTGIKAGGALRVVLELAGVPNAVGKLLGSKNKINNAKATIKALQELQRPPAKSAQGGSASGGKQEAAADEKKSAKEAQAA